SRLLFVETAAFGMFRRMSLLLPLSFSRPCGERGSADRARGGVQGAREPDGDELVVVRLAGGAAGGEREVVVFFLVRAASPWAPSRSMIRNRCRSTMTASPMAWAGSSSG